MINKKNFKLFLMTVFIVFLFVDTILMYNRFRQNKSIFGLKLNKINISTLTKSQIVSIIKKRFDKDISLKLSFENKIFQIRKKDVGARIDYQKSLDQIFDEGRNKNVFSNIIKQAAALFGLNNLKAKGQISKTLLLVKVLDIEDQINKEARPPMPDFAGNWANTLPAKDGIKVDSSKLSQIILNNIFNPPGIAIAIPTQKIVKNYGTVDIASIRRQAAEYISQPISITSGGVIFILSTQDLKSLLTVGEDPDPTNPKKTVLAVQLDRAKLNQKLDPYAAKVESMTQSEFNYHEARAAIYGQFYTNTRRLTEVPIGSKAMRQVLGTSTTTTGSKEKVVYLTFDDGPNIVYHPMLLDILKEKGVKATFYFVGSNSKLYANTTKRTIAEGHLIGDHSLTHAYLPKLLPNQILDEIKTTRDILNSFLVTDHKTITLFRPPYGGINSTVSKNATDLGMKTDFWSLDPRDWSDPPTDELVKRVVDDIKDGDVILLHSNHLSTVKALPLIIDKLRAKGFQFKLEQ